MQSHSIAPQETFLSLWRNRTLFYALTKREIVGRYRGSFLGLRWSFFNPLFMLAVYTFVFSVVFRVRWGEAGSGSRTEFALILFAGLIVFNLFAECFIRAPELILSNVNYVKKIVFPLEILPWVTLGAALFQGLISVLVWLGAYFLFFGLPHFTIIFLPVIFIPLGFLILGLSWALASLGAYLRDVSQVVGLLATVFMFLSPIFYPLSAVPATYRPLLWLNPLMPAIEMTRAVLYWGHMPNWGHLGAYYLATALIAWLGFAWFQKTRKGFADVL
jgi:lipopolysaccharide transport system permease protein